MSEHRPVNEKRHLSVRLVLHDVNYDQSCQPG
jgi:hypothetical protein